MAVRPGTVGATRPDIRTGQGRDPTGVDAGASVEAKKAATMKHWCAPWKVLLVTALACQLTGCSRFSQTVAKWSGKDVDTSVAATDKGAKSSKTAASPGKSSSTDAKIAAADKALKDATGGKPAAKSTAAGKESLAKAAPRVEPKADTRADVRVAAAPAKKGTGWDEDPFMVDSPKGESWSRSGVARTAPSGTTAQLTKRETAVAKEKAFLEDDWSFAEAAGQQAVDDAVKGLKSKEIQEVSHSTARDGRDLLGEAEKSLGALDRKLAAAEERAIAAKAADVRLIPDEPVRGTPTKSEFVKSADKAIVAVKGTASLPNISPATKPIITPAAARQPQMTPETSAKLRNWTDRNQQALSLVALCPQADGQVQELVKNLETRDVEQIKKATNELGRLGSQSLAAAPALRQLLQHADGMVRVNASLALTRIEGSTPQSIATLVEALKHEDSAVRSYAAAVLSGMGPQAADAVPALTDALQDSNAYVRLHVAEVLIRYGQWSQPALKTLLGCLEDQDANVRWLTAYSLAELAPQSQETVNALRLALRDPEEKVRVGAIYALGELGPMALPAENDLRKLTQDSNAEVRTTAEQSLRQIHRG